LRPQFRQEIGDYRGIVPVDDRPEEDRHRMEAADAETTRDD